MKLRAERRLGELLEEQARKQGQRDETFHDERFAIPKLSELRITELQSHRWQRLFDIPEEHLVRYIAECGEREELTTAGFLRFHLKILREGEGESDSYSVSR